MHYLDTAIPLDTYDVPRETAVKAVAALIRLGATDLVPMLFAPVTLGLSYRGYGPCRVCGRHMWLQGGVCRQKACAGGTDDAV